MLCIVWKLFRRAHDLTCRVIESLAEFWLFRYVGRVQSKETDKCLKRLLEIWKQRAIYSPEKIARLDAALKVYYTCHTCFIIYSLFCFVLLMLCFTTTSLISVGTKESRSCWSGSGECSAIAQGKAAQPPFIAAQGRFGCFAVRNKYNLTQHEEFYSGAAILILLVFFIFSQKIRSHTMPSRWDARYRKWRECWSHFRNRRPQMRGSGERMSRLMKKAIFEISLHFSEFLCWWTGIGVPPVYFVRQIMLPSFSFTCRNTISNYPECVGNVEKLVHLRNEQEARAVQAYVNSAEPVVKDYCKRWSTSSSINCLISVCVQCQRL